jgi:hypothetical protein
VFDLVKPHLAGRRRDRASCCRRGAAARHFDPPLNEPGPPPRQYERAKVKSA